MCKSPFLSLVVSALLLSACGGSGRGDDGAPVADGEGEGEGAPLAPGDGGGGGEGEAEAEAEAEAEGEGEPVEGEAEAEAEDEGSQVGFSGAQDFGLFRAIVESGGIPGPNTLDAAGFFAEHWLDLPPPECEQDVCLHGLLGVAEAMMTGNNCTLLRVGLNTPFTIGEIEALPRNLVAVIDRSGSMAGESRIEYVRAGLHQMLDALAPEDALGIVVYSTGAEVLREALPVGEERDGIHDLIDGIAASGSTNLHGGLELGFVTLDAVADLEHENRVLLLSDGLANVGVTDPRAILQMAFGWAAEGLALTTIGVGTDFNIALMRSLAENGGGNFYFVDDAPAITQVFVDELDFLTRPIAHDVTITLSPGPGYVAAETFGTRLWERVEGGLVQVRLPSLFIGRRRDIDDAARGRRGSGGTLLTELVPLPGWDGEGDGGQVGTVDLRYRPAGADAYVELSSQVRYSRDPGVTLGEGEWSEIAGSDFTMRKAFVMLNIFAAFRAAATFAAGGTLDPAYEVLDRVEARVDDWLDEYDDPDIADDQELMLRFIINLAREGADGVPDLEVEDKWEYD